MSLASTAFTAIGVENRVTVADESALPLADAIARAEIAALDLACSRFRPDSELERLNAAGSGAVSPLLLEAIDAALWAAEASGGLVDPTVGDAVRALGYDRDFDIVVRRGARPAFDVVPATGWRSVEVDRATATIRLHGGELDLGATAKALVADRIAAAVLEQTGSAVLVACGGDIAVAGAPPEGGWPVGLADDHRSPAVPSTPVVGVRAGGLATSSTTVRRWRAGGADVHHIVDPSTGRSASTVWRSVTCAAASCVKANTASTAAIVAGPAAPAWLERRSVPARLVAEDGSVVLVGGWPG